MNRDDLAAALNPGEVIDALRSALASQPEALALFEQHIGHDRDAIGFALAANIGPVRLAALPPTGSPETLRDALEHIVKVARSRPGYVLTEVDVRRAEDALDADRAALEGSPE